MKKCLNYKIREIRVRNNLTIQQMASSLEIAASTLGMYERGMRKPDIAVMARIAKMLNVDIKYFYEEDFEIDEIASNIEYLQDSKLVDEARRRANGFCELCEARAPFILDNGEPYLEVFHIKSRGYNNETNEIVLLCPNCNKKVEIIKNPGDINYLLRKVRKNTKDG
ncbi:MULTISPECIES: helix-turn-helix domain-containing protein [Clostridium]|jgi:transcriptional regulator with XRE-family HTH domain|uniref:Uncharacterized protein n=2 Tax=Clostridium TaxID=1485 RepID=A0A1S8QU25_CLOBE|nr:MULTISPECIES: helix-turn-helix domain-containing protein [Clostridium]EKQ57731.1 MAG: putative transcriptional regulator [Clostridium sp. Maddingley MBC34-26]MZK52594.1 helix-turn-helix domain-containing protein [Clostridium beijerinckii]MZK60632.1 helix-turn-helix domain-containing protein [Clostridium beijerinckii]MZK70907.1 helix-turn-helix domain-containing protein [Clostridium beijerinckii]MZK76262.1 helix-turn-helix domain-containing protein [Clostridium beijerinckii]